MYADRDILHCLETQREVQVARAVPCVAHASVELSESGAFVETMGDVHARVGFEVDLGVARGAHPVEEELEQPPTDPAGTGAPRDPRVVSPKPDKGAHTRDNRRTLDDRRPASDLVIIFKIRTFK